MRVIETSRFYLRPLQLSDAAGILEIFGSQEAMTYAPIRVTQRSEDAEAFVTFQQKSYARDGFGVWAIVSKQDDRFVGHGGLIRQEAGVEVFFAVVPDLWGRGVATEIASACRDHAIEVLGQHRVISIIHPKNLRAIRVAEKIGMHRAGEIRVWDRENLLFEFKVGSNQ